MICKCFKKKKKVDIKKEIEDKYKDVPLHYKLALKNVGLKEIYGKASNPKIVDMFKIVVGKEYPDSVSWCAAFVGYCLSEAGKESSGELTARSYLKIGEEVSEPKLGDIVILWREKPSSWKGHVGFYAGEDEKYIKILGGNQSNKVQVSRYPKSRLLGYRRA